MTKRSKVLLIIVIVWSAIVGIDLLATGVLVGRPLFCIGFWGGEAVFYLGLGYSVTAIYPLTTIEQASVSYQYFFWPYIIIMLLLVSIIVYDVVKTKRAQSGILK